MDFKIHKEARYFPFYPSQLLMKFTRLSRLSLSYVIQYKCCIRSNLL